MQLFFEANKVAQPRIVDDRAFYNGMFIAFIS